MLEKAGRLSGFCVRKELDKSGCFFAPSASCFNAEDEDDEATSSAAHELAVCTLLSASGFNKSIGRKVNNFKDEIKNAFKKTLNDKPNRRKFK